MRYLNHIQPILIDELAHQLNALLVGGDLSVQVGQVVLQEPRARATRILRRRVSQRGNQLSLLEPVCRIWI